MEPVQGLDTHPPEVSGPRTTKTHLPGHVHYVDRATGCGSCAFFVVDGGGTAKDSKPVFGLAFLRLIVSPNLYIFYRPF